MKPRASLPAGAALALGLLLAGTARAADHFNEPLARASDKIGIVGERATRVLRAVAPGRAFPLRGEAAVQRYMDCMADEMLGDYDHAASGLFTLVTTGVLVEFGLHRDAEWSLAESLFGGGNDETAEIRLKAILDDPTHPFRPDAVRTLLELYAKEGRTEEFYALYQAEIASGRVRATDVITYSIGKSFFIQGTFSMGEASKQFQAVPTTSRFYGRAQYFLGAIAVKAGDLAGAAPIFEAVTKLPVSTDDDRKVRDLATLALGRIYYERSEFAQAQEYYSQIAGDSPYLDQALYESAWNFIKQGKNAEALRAIDTYLLSFPAGEGAAELQVVQGQLHMLDQSWDDALGSFDHVVSAYTPVKEQFGSLARSTEAPDVYFQRVLAIGQGKSTDVPDYARTLILADKDLAAAIHLFTTLDQEHNDIVASQQLIVDLQEALSGAERLDLVTTRAEIDSVQGQIDEQRKGLLELEEQWLSENGATKVQLDPLRTQRLALGDSPTPDAVRALRSEYATLRKGRSPSTLTRIDELHGALDRAEGELTDSVARLTSPDVEDVKKLRTVFDAEVANVQSEEADQARTTVEAQRVSVALTRSGFGRLEDLFGKSVLSADMGIVDVYWGEKIETASHKEDVLQQRVDTMADLDRRFDMIRQKLGQE